MEKLKYEELVNFKNAINKDPYLIIYFAPWWIRRIRGIIHVCS